MPKCKNCKYGIEMYDVEWDEIYFHCNVDNDYIPADVADDDTLDCDFYVDNRDDNTTKKS